MISAMNTRQQYILNRIEVTKKVQVTELAESLDVSEVTIRKDLQELEGLSLLKRVYGGAIDVRRSKYNPALEQRKITPEKLAIAHSALELIDDGDTLIIDAGSTTLALVQLLRDTFRSLCIVSNSLPIINELAQSPFELVALGGELRRHSHACIGPITVASLRQLHADKAFLGATGLCPRHGLSTPNIIEADTKKAMLAAARERIVLADSSKFVSSSLANFAKWSDIHTLVSEGKDCHFFHSLEAQGVRVHVSRSSPLAV